MKVLVTGGSGLIGRHTVELLLRDGYEVRTFQRGPLAATEMRSPAEGAETHGRASDARPAEAARAKVVSDDDRHARGRTPAAGVEVVRGEAPRGEVAQGEVVRGEAPRREVARGEVVRGDVRTDLRSLCAAAAGCGAVVHLAGRGDVADSRRDPLGYARLNADGTLNALEAARAAGAIFVLASSQRVYPLRPLPCREDDPLAPDSPYGYTKWVAELWCRMASEQFGVSTRVLRFFSVYGPGQQPNGGSGVVTIFARAALSGAPLVVQSAGRRDFTDARDVARGILLAIRAPSDGAHRVYNVATGVGTTFRALAELVIAVAGSPSSIEQRIEEPPGRDLVADIARARAELGYTPCIPLHQGLEHYLRWLRRQWPGRQGSV